MQGFRKLAQWMVCKNQGELRARCQAFDKYPYYKKPILAQNHKPDKVITFEPDAISTRSKRHFVDLGEVNTHIKL